MNLFEISFANNLKIPSPIKKVERSRKFSHDKIIIIISEERNVTDKIKEFQGTLSVSFGRIQTIEENYNLRVSDTVLR
jgi:hypothetical protein